VRLEQPAVRALSSHRLRQKAEQQGRRLSVLSLSSLQVRRGMSASMWGRYTLDGNPRVHIAICGSGPGLQAVAYEIARQGFGLETDKPLLSILRTGTSDFSAGALERLVASVGCEVQVTAAAAATPGALDPAIATIIADHPPLLAIHCIADTEGEAEELAQRWEDVLVLEQQPVPPIVAYTGETRPLGRTGIIRVADAPDLAEALAVEQLMDRRAIAVHEQFLTAQRAARGEQFGEAPAEVPWAKLAENFRDDNRAVADQMDYKLARVRMLSQPGNAGAPLTPDAIDDLAAVAHARWMAARSLAGWTYAPERDNKGLRHPDLMPFDDLTEAGKQKDRDEVMTLPELAGLAGEALRREHRVPVALPLSGPSLDNLLERLGTMPVADFPVVVIPADDPEMFETAEALLAKDYAIEAVIGSMAETSDPAQAARRAAIVRAAYRIHAARDRTAREAVASQARAPSRETTDA
jgi:RyR domain